MQGQRLLPLCLPLRLLLRLPLRLLGLWLLRQCLRPQGQRLQG
jgi:hypothetical protein